MSLLASLIKGVFGRPVSAAESSKDRGNEWLAQGRFDEAADCYRQAIDAEPNYAEAHNNLGFVYARLGQMREAEACYRHALTLKDDLGPAHFNLSTLLVANGNLDGAWDHCQRAKRLSPPNVDIYVQLGEILFARQEYDQAVALLNEALSIGLEAPIIQLNLGISYRELKRYVEAEAAFRRTIALDPGNPHAHYELGMLFKQDGLRAAAEKQFRAAVESKSDFAAANVNLGLLMAEDGRPAEAEAAYRAALAANPDYPEGLNNLGVVLLEAGRLAEAEECFRRASSNVPGTIEYRCNLGVVLHKLMRYADAEEAYRDILRIKPDHDPTLDNLGCLLAELKRFDEAEEAFRRALSIAPESPEARRDFGYTLLSIGRLADAWPLHEARFDPRLKDKKFMVQTPPVPFPQWRDESLRGRSLLVWYEQGFGDEIQFARYIPLLKRQGAAHVSLMCTAPLRELFETLEGLDEIYVAKDGVEVRGHDFWVLSMSLPFHFGTSLANIPAEIPYLRASPRRIERWQERLPREGLRVGLVWKGNPKHKNDANRSLPGLETMAPLWQVPGVSFVSLQKGAGEEEAKYPPGNQPLIHLGSEMESFADSAAIVSQLDLVISVDTALVHVAGALGKPCWVLLPRRGTDWRWLQERSDSPWYPKGMRLFRQQNAGDWHGVVGDLTDELRALTASAR